MNEILLVGIVFTVIVGTIWALKRRFKPKVEKEIKDFYELMGL